MTIIVGAVKMFIVVGLVLLTMKYDMFVFIVGTILALKLVLEFILLFAIRIIGKKMNASKVIVDRVDKLREILFYIAGLPMSGYIMLRAWNFTTNKNLVLTAVALYIILMAVEFAIPYIFPMPPKACQLIREHRAENEKTIQ